MGPLELLKLAGGVEKLLHEVHVVTLNEVGMQLDQGHSTLQNQLSMPSKKQWKEIGTEIGTKKEVYVISI